MKYDVDRLYQTTPLDTIPWNCETPPYALASLVKSGKVSPCKTIDLGCGTGNYAMYLAGLGFDVTGIDSSPTAISIARENAEKRGVLCMFVTGDLLGDLHEIRGKFDFGFDWEVLHTIYPEDRATYVRNLCRLLNTGARYLSVCFSELDPQFGGSGKYRPTPAGTTLYFSSEEEIRDLFSPEFIIKDQKTIDVPGKPYPHKAVYLLAERR
ncbi:MAG: class I SAM-dependent methyltransferase [Methanomicrobiales archaeon]